MLQHFTTSLVRYKCPFASSLPTLASGKLINVFADFMEGNGVLFILQYFQCFHYEWDWGYTYFQILIICILFFYDLCIQIIALLYYIPSLWFIKTFCTVYHEHLPFSILYVLNYFSCLVVFLLTLLIVGFIPEKFYTV